MASFTQRCNILKTWVTVTQEADKLAHRNDARRARRLRKAASRAAIESEGKTSNAPPKLTKAQMRTQKKMEGGRQTEADYRLTNANLGSKFEQDRSGDA